MIQFKVKRTPTEQQERYSDGSANIEQGLNKINSDDDTELPSLRPCYMIEDFENFLDYEKPINNFAALFANRYSSGG